MQHDQQPQLLTKHDLCARLSISIRTIENLVKAGSFPPPVRIGKCVYWSEIAVSKWQRRLFAEQENWGH
jgi:predicted DNA-binding transcriptional regulator AlpA